MKRCDQDGGEEAGGTPDGLRVLPGREKLWRDRGNYRWLSAYSATLVSARHDFGGDLDRLLVYLIFAMSEMSRRLDGSAQKGINALSVADITLIPRETVRRKLRELVNLGHLRQGDDGLWYVDDHRRLDNLTETLHGLFGAGTDRRSAA